MSAERSFRIVSIKPDDGIQLDGGVYKGRGPGQAALKAFNWYCRKAELTTCEKKFTIEETTRGKPTKQFHYTGVRKELGTPHQIERNGKTYEVKYETTVHKQII